MFIQRWKRSTTPLFTALLAVMAARSAAGCADPSAPEPIGLAPAADEVVVLGGGPPPGGGDDPDRGPGCLQDGSYFDGKVVYPPGSSVAVAMCVCRLADPACGAGFCDQGAYCTGPSCGAPVCYPPDAEISKIMCQGAKIDPKTCEIQQEERCTPEIRTFTAGVDDNFSTANGAEPPSPSPALLAHIASVYPYPGSRDFDDPSIDRWFAHTFTGLEPRGGAHLCGATLHARVSQSPYSLCNDGLGLFFMNPDGTVSGPGYYPSLADLGVPCGTTGEFTLDLDSLPSGSLLSQMENGWLDVTVQDDSAVDFLELNVKYCCEDCDSHTPPLPGIVGYWSLDEHAGPLSVDQVQGNNGSWYGAPTPVPGIGCGALSFDGVQDYEITSSSSALDFGTGDFSLSFYVTTSSPGLNVILDKRVETSGPVQGWAAYTYGSGLIGFQLADGWWTSYPSTAFVADGVSHHVVITVERQNPAGIRVYLDKNLTDIHDPTSHPGSVSNQIPMSIARRSDHPSWPGFFPGTLDEISLYRRALTPAEILSL